MKVRRSVVRRSTLPDSFFDASWKGVVARREAKARTARRAPALALAAMLFAVVCFAWARNAAFSPFVAATQHEVHALGTRGGGALAALDARDGSEPLIVELDDGSTITLAAGARLVPVRNDARAIDFELRAGKATYDVRPGGPRVWSVRAGDVLVTVLGTRFSVSRAEDGVLVAVERGSVMVRAARLPEHERRLLAGEQVVIADAKVIVEAPLVTGEPSSPDASRPVRPEGPDPAPVRGHDVPPPPKGDKSDMPRVVPARATASTASTASPAASTASPAAAASTASPAAAASTASPAAAASTASPAAAASTASLAAAASTASPAASASTASPAAAASTASPAASTASTASPAPASATSARPGSAASASSAPDWENRARAADFARAYQVLGPGGVASEAGRTEDLRRLMLLADVARLSGHPAEAIAPLERVLRIAPRDPSAALVAFTLGKIELDALGRPAQAAAFFAKCIELGAPKSLEEDAYLRWGDALERAGDRTGADRVDRLYRARYPSGRHVGERRRPPNSP